MTNEDLDLTPTEALTAALARRFPDLLVAGYRQPAPGMPRNEFTFTQGDQMVLIAAAQTLYMRLIQQWLQSLRPVDPGAL